MFFLRLRAAQRERGETISEFEWKSKLTAPPSSPPVLGGDKGGAAGAAGGTTGGVTGCAIGTAALDEGGGILVGTFFLTEVAGFFTAEAGPVGAAGAEEK
jgi:hypothetical protein